MLLKRETSYRTRGTLGLLDARCPAARLSGPLGGGGMELTFLAGKMFLPRQNLKKQTSIINSKITFLEETEEPRG
jgi:hypothetical protein